MKKTMQNMLIEGFVSTMGEQNSFMKTVRMPQALRQALRINYATLSERLKVYMEGRADIAKNYVANGYATENENGSINIQNEYLPAINQELKELAEVENELEIETVKKSVVDMVLLNNNLTLGEEDVLLFFADDEEE